MKPLSGTLLPVPLQFVERYQVHSLCAVKAGCAGRSNQKCNEYLNEIAEVCGITKRLTYHMARHTFATTITLNNGVPIETVSKLLGHKNLRITQHYAKTLDRKVSEDMKALQMKLHAVQQDTPQQEATGYRGGAFRNERD